MTTHINHNTRSLTFTVPYPGKSTPVLALMRIGQSSTTNLAFKGRKGDRYTFGLPTTPTLKPGRYYAMINFGGCCCLKTEVLVDSSCNLLETSTTSVATGCATC